jgi:signal transduction histidine kinase
VLFRTVLETLLKNAVENTPDGGEITVRVKRAEQGVLLEVQDAGVGITIQDQEFIFEGFLYTQPTDEYSSKHPFAFNAGGKGLELRRLKVLAESGYFDIRFESSRCCYIPTRSDRCPGHVESCPSITGLDACRKSGGTTFFVLFRSSSRSQRQ